VYHYVAAHSSFMTVYVADAHAHVQRLVSVGKIVNVLEEYTTEDRCSVVRFLWPLGVSAKNVHEEMFPVYSGRCLSRKAVHNRVEKFSQGHSKVAYDALQGAEVADTKLTSMLRVSTHW
jgi:hypothetical protein